MTAKERGQRWRAKQLKERPEEFRKYNADRAKERYKADPEIARIQQENFKKSYHENAEFRAKVVRSASLGRYGKTPAEYDAQLAEQHGHCALCKSTDGDAGRRLHVDHSHDCCDKKTRTCGECNRGLLCGICNRRLAAVEAILKEAIIVPERGTWTARAMQYLAYWDSDLAFRKFSTKKPCS